MRPGDTTVLSWNVSVTCGAVLYEGVVVDFEAPDGTHRTELLPAPNRLVFLTGQRVHVDLHWVMFPTSMPGSYLITVTPVWIDSYSIRRTRGATGEGSSGVRIVVPPPDAI